MYGKVAGFSWEHGSPWNRRERRELLRRLEELADIRRAIRDLPAAAQTHAIDDSPVDQGLPRVGVVARLVVRLAIAELEIQLLSTPLVSEQRHEHLAV